MNRFYSCWIGLFLLLPSQLGAQTPLKVQADVERGFYTESFTLNLSSNDSAAIIHYSLDGEPPGPASGQVYTGPLQIQTTTPLQAIAFNASDTSTLICHTYIFLADILTQPNSKTGYPSGMALDASVSNHPLYGAQMLEALVQIPSVSIVTGIDSFNSFYYTKGNTHTGSIEIIYPDGRESYQQYGGMESYGNSTFNQAKKNFRFVFKTQYGGNTKFEYPVFGDSAANDFDYWVLRAGGQETMQKGGVQNLNDQAMRDLQTQISGVGVHGDYFHVYLNGIYWGLYNAAERPQKSFAESYFGGIKEDWNTLKATCCNTTLHAIDGTKDSWNHMLANVHIYDSAQKHLDIDQFIDYVMVNNYGPHGDWRTWNSYIVDNPVKGEPFRFYVWDSEPGFQSAWYYTNYTVNTKDYENIWQPLKANDEFKMRVADHMQCNCFDEGFLTPQSVSETYLRLYDKTYVAYMMEAARWWDVSVYDGFISYKDDLINSYFPARTNTLVTTYRNNDLYPDLDAVGFSQDQGAVPAGFQLSLNNPNASGAIYYTTDNSDPRAEGGLIAPGAQTYISSFALPYPVTEVKARVYDGNEWSAACPKRYYAPQDFSKLIINEIHYHPDSTCGAEFIELLNVGTVDLDLTDCHFDDGIRLTFPMRTTLAPGAFLVLARDTESFYTAYGFNPDGEYEGKLSNKGERIVLRNPLGFVIDSLKYQDDFLWDTLADGYGPSLERLHPELVSHLPGSWLASNMVCGTPKASNSRQCVPDTSVMLVNEINYNGDFYLQGLDAGDWIELKNTGANTIDLSKWQLIDTDEKLEIPLGVSIQPDSFLVLAKSLVDMAAVHPGIGPILEMPGLGLSGKGEAILIRDSLGCPISELEYDNKEPWPEEADGEGASLMLLDPLGELVDPNSWQASGNFSGTPGKENQLYCQQAPIEIIINEINYKSTPLNDAKDWIELYNPNGVDIDLSGWELHDGDNYFRIPTGTLIAANGYLVLAQDLIAFNSQFPSVMNVTGNWTFGLGGDGEWVVLLTQERCYVDGLKYNDSPPWPIEPDGNGPTLALMSPDLENEIPGSWAPSTWGGALFGTPGGPNMIPDPCQSQSDTAIMIHEIHYRSADTFDMGNWVEIFNPYPYPVDISGWMLLDEDSVYAFPNLTMLDAQDYLILAEDPSNVNLLNLISVQGGDPPIGPMGFQLNNGGERLLLYTAGRCLVDEVPYENQSPWPVSPTDETTISLLAPDLDNKLGQNWTLSLMHGSPGGQNEYACVPTPGLGAMDLWLRADTSFAPGDSVAVWNDLGPNQLHLQQMDSTAQPQYTNDLWNGWGALSFDGANDYFGLDSLAEVLGERSTVFAVVRPKADSIPAHYLYTHQQNQPKGGFGHNTDGNLIFREGEQILQAGDFHDKATIVRLQLEPDQKVLTAVNGQPANSWNQPSLKDATGAFIGKGSSIQKKALYLEAEYATIGSQFKTRISAKASAANYVVKNGTSSPVAAPVDEADRIRFQFELSQSGNYRLYARILAPTSSQNSFWVRANEGSWVRWEDIQVNSSFNWTQLHDADNGNQTVLLPLIAGLNTIDFAYNEAGTQLDKIYINFSSDPPDDFGELADNLPPGSFQNGDNIMNLQRWDGIGGTSVANLTGHANYPNSPTLSQTVNGFESPTNVANNYGLRLWGFIIPPQSGNYTFWIAGDDNVELWLSTDDDSANVVKIAWHNSWTNSRQWDKFGTQQSSPVSLQAGNRYYVEAFVKEQGGGDNLAVGWQLPDGSLDRPISPQYLKAYDAGEPVSDLTELSLEAEYAEVGTNFTSQLQHDASAAHFVKVNGLNSTASPPLGENDRVRFNFSIKDSGDYHVFARVKATAGSADAFWVRVNEGNWIRWDGILSGAGYQWDHLHDADNGNQEVLVPLNAGVNSLDFAYNEAGTQLDKVYISQDAVVPQDYGYLAENLPSGPYSDGKEAMNMERWEGISGTAVSNLTADPDFPESPDYRETIGAFESPTNILDHYGVRIWGFLKAPQSGNYTFWIAGDDNVELWLSTDADSANVNKIAWHNGWTNSQVWNKYGTQQSSPIPLIAGNTYYVEAYMKEHGGGDNLAVGWQLPDGTLDRPISPQYILAYEAGEPNYLANVEYEFWKGEMAELLIVGDSIQEDQHQDIEGYLAIKYGLSLLPENHPFYSDTSHALHQVGLALDYRRCWGQFESRNQEGGILRLFQPESLENGESIVLGHNGQSAHQSAYNLDVPNGVEARTARVWRVSEIGEVGSIQMEFDLETLGWAGTDPQSWILMVDDDGDFSNATILPATSFANDLLQFSVNLADGDYVSFGHRNLVRFQPKAILSGAYDLTNGLMWDSLRVVGIIPLTDPYWSSFTIESSVLDSSGTNAVVDWLAVEIRQATDSAIVDSQAALLLRNGTVVGLDGSSALSAYISPGYYYIVLRHRNHLPVISDSLIHLTENISEIDFRAGGAGGIHPMRQLQAGLFGLWAGNANGDPFITFQGGINDPGAVFLKVLSDPTNITFARNFVSFGYDATDTNLDGKIIFQGGNADTNPIFLNVLSHPLNTSFNRNFVITTSVP